MRAVYFTLPCQRLKSDMNYFQEHKEISFCQQTDPKTKERLLKSSVPTQQLSPSSVFREQASPAEQKEILVSVKESQTFCSSCLLVLLKSASFFLLSLKYAKKFISIKALFFFVWKKTKKTRPPPRRVVVFYNFLSDPGKPGVR